jgi:hypothetical protein
VGWIGCARDEIQVAVYRGWESSAREEFAIAPEMVPATNFNVLPEVESDADEAFASELVSANTSVPAKTKNGAWHHF